MEIVGKVVFDNYFYLQFLIYLLIPCLCLFSFKYSGIESVNKIDRDVTYAIRGAAMLLIMLHHFIGYLYEKSVMVPYHDMGYVGSGIFLFFSGYGIACGVEKQGYLKEFMKKRIGAIYIRSIFLMGILGILSCLLVNQKFSLDFFKILYLRNFWNSSQVWFFTAIFYCYFLIYTILRWINSENMRLFLLFTGLAIWIVCCIIVEKPVCWYNTVLLFGLGYIWKYIGVFKSRKNVLVLAGGAYKYSIICLGIWKR